MDATLGWVIFTCFTGMSWSATRFVVAEVRNKGSDRETAFSTLNAILNSEEPEETIDLVDELERLCADSDLESVEFGPYDAPGEKPFAVSTFVDTEDQMQMTI